MSTIIDYIKKHRLKNGRYYKLKYNDFATYIIRYNGLEDFSSTKYIQKTAKVYGKSAFNKNANLTIYRANYSEINHLKKCIALGKYVEYEEEIIKNTNINKELNNLIRKTRKSYKL